MQGTLSARRVSLHLFGSLLIFALLASFFAVAAVQGSQLIKHNQVTPSVLGGINHYVDVGSAINATTFTCQSDTAPTRCYGPQQLRNAYNVQPLLDQGKDGKGRTIVIIDAFQSPTIQHDLDLFSQVFGIPSTQVSIIAPDGLTPFDPNNGLHTGWAGEITLDVEWAHAVAPGATLKLVLAKSSDDADILSATKYVVEHHLGDVVSQSFGEAESCMDSHLLQQQHLLFTLGIAKGMTFLASAGDQGAAQPSCDGSSYIKSASTPATDPFVTAVGGTQLNADPITGAYRNEVVWNEPAYGGDATGGGYSTVYSKPVYQLGFKEIQGGKRAVPDISMNAAINGGVLAVWSSSGRGADRVFIFGGTSASSPEWAGLVAIAGQIRGWGGLGEINSALYLFGRSHGNPFSGAYHDITVGNNTYDNGTIHIDGYSAGPGWDASTGFGTPDAAKIVPLLAHFA